MNYKKYFELLVGTVTMLFLGLIYAWSIFREPISIIYKTWSITQISFTFTISLIFFCLGGFFSGKKYPEYGHKKISIISSLLLLTGFMGASFISKFSSQSALISLYIFYGVLCGFGVGMAYNAIMGSVVGKFEKNSGLVSGVLLMGFGLGGVFFGTTAKIMISSLGLFIAFRVFAIAISIVIAISSILIKTIEVQESTVKYKTSAIKDYPPSKMLKSKIFWCFIIWIVLLNSAGLMVINSAASITLHFGASAILGLIGQIW